jgi:hypothetical protein
MEVTVSETSGTESIGEPDVRDVAEEDLEEQTGRLEERERRQQGVQQHGDTFAVESDQPTDTSGVPHGAPNRVTALPGDEPAGEADS